MTEWSEAHLSRLLQTNLDFRVGITNLFFKGAASAFLVKHLPLFDLKKLSIGKLEFDPDEMLDTLVRYKVRDARAGKQKNNPERLIEAILTRLEVKFGRGELSQLVENAYNTKRAMDFLIPDGQDPLIVIESSFLVTTSSNQGDKSKTEIAVKSQLRAYYPRATFVGFIDGIGWFVRKGDLKRMVSAYDHVFTFHQDELQRFETFLIDQLKRL